MPTKKRNLALISSVGEFKNVKLTFTTRHLNTSSKISPKPIIKKKIPSPHDLGIHHIFKHFRPIINPLLNIVIATVLVKIRDLSFHKIATINHPIQPDKVTQRFSGCT